MADREDAGEIGWFFPSTGGGQQTGLNDPGIEFFRGSSSLARETIQNVGDARSPDAVRAGLPAVVRFELLEVPASALPGLPGLKNVLTRASERLAERFKNRSLPEQNGAPFFRRALELCHR